jgi:hypothetical protein
MLFISLWCICWMVCEPIIRINSKLLMLIKQLYTYEISFKTFGEFHNFISRFVHKVNIFSYPIRIFRGAGSVQGTIGNITSRVSTLTCYRLFCDFPHSRFTSRVSTLACYRSCCDFPHSRFTSFCGEHRLWLSFTVYVQVVCMQVVCSGCMYAGCVQITEL